MVQVYHAPSICFFIISVRMSDGFIATIVTFPPFSTVLNPLFTRYFLNDMSCVLPIWGEANFLPPKSLTEFIPESFLTTKTAPPLAAPDTICKPLFPDAIYPLMAGFRSAMLHLLDSIMLNSADGPSYKTNSFIFVLL